MERSTHTYALCLGVVDPWWLLYGQHSLRQMQSLCGIGRFNS
jgi:hypothetical protein